MKNIKLYYQVLLLMIVITSTSCDVNNLSPSNQLSEETAFRTAERVELAVAGVYDGGQSGTYVGGAVRGYTFGAAHLQQGDCRGEDMVSVAAFYNVTYASTYDATSPNNDFYWQNAYTMINRANVVIDGVRKAPVSSALTQVQKNSYEAECRFLRALGHFYLLVNWAKPYGTTPTAAAGGIPYRDKPVLGLGQQEEGLAQGRNTVQECYTKIIEDLTFAEQNLPATRTTNKITRATAGAAIAFKTRVYLHQNNWTSVITEAQKLVPGSATLKSPIGSYELTASPYGAFGTSNKSNVESIFSFENSDTDNGGINGANSTMYSAVASTGRGIIAISPIVWNLPEFRAADIRKSSLMVQQDAVGSAGRGAFFSKKYADATNRTDNAPIIRYAEVLLNLAEAIVRNTNTVDANAVALLSAVRNRSTDVAGQYSVASFANSKALLSAILAERRIEFIAEGMRWLDIHRLSTDADFSAGGIPLKIGNGTTNYSPLYKATDTSVTPTYAVTLALIPISDRRFLWPIPLSETTNNPTLAKQQNPGW